MNQYPASDLTLMVVNCSPSKTLEIVDETPGAFTPRFRRWRRVGRLRVKTEQCRPLLEGMFFLAQGTEVPRNTHVMRSSTDQWNACLVLGRELYDLYDEAERLDRVFVDPDLVLQVIEDVRPIEPKVVFVDGDRVRFAGGLFVGQIGTITWSVGPESVVELDGASFPVRTRSSLLERLPAPAAPVTLGNGPEVGAAELGSGLEER